MIGVQFSSSRRIKREDIEELKARYSILDIESDTLWKCNIYFYLRISFNVLKIVVFLFLYLLFLVSFQIFYFCKLVYVLSLVNFLISVNFYTYLILFSQDMTHLD